MYEYAGKVDKFKPIGFVMKYKEFASSGQTQGVLQVLLQISVLECYVQTTLLIEWRKEDSYG